jgi:hypothetical protein
VLSRRKRSRRRGDIPAACTALQRPGLAFGGLGGAAAGLAHAELRRHLRALRHILQRSTPRRGPELHADAAPRHRHTVCVYKSHRRTSSFPSQQQRTRDLLLPNFVLRRHLRLRHGG